MKFFTKKISKLIFWTLASILVLYTVVGFIIVPMIIKSKAIDYIKEELGRDAEIESVSFNPFTFSLSIEGFRLYEKEKQEIFLFQIFTEYLKATIKSHLLMMKIQLIISLAENPQVQQPIQRSILAMSYVTLMNL